MPNAPKRACLRCRRLNCTDPTHKPKPRERTQRKQPRPDYNTSRERSRRKAAVDAFLAEHGRECASGDVIARCPECRQMRARWVADHVTPIAQGGHEDGPLAVHCSSCSARQGARLANQGREQGQTRTHSMKRTTPRF